MTVTKKLISETPLQKVKKELREVKKELAELKRALNSERTTHSLAVKESRKKVSELHRIIDEKNESLIDAQLAITANVAGLTGAMQAIEEKEYVISLLARHAMQL